MSLRAIAASALFTLALAVAAPAVAAAKFTAWHGKDVIYEGEGGEMEEVNGIQFWSNGDPPRSFKLLGYISDTRLSTGLVGMMRVKNRNKEIAEVAKANGGDAVILVDAATATRGYVSNANAFGSSAGSSSAATATGFRTAVQNESTRYAVIKYVDETSAITSAGAPATAASAVPATAEDPLSDAEPTSPSRDGSDTPQP